jgi:hypothetical protein
MECHVRVYQNFTHPDPSSKDKDPNLNALRVRDLHCVTVEIGYEVIQELIRGLYLRADVNSGRRARLRLAKHFIILVYWKSSSLGASLQ